MTQDYEKMNIQWFPGHMTKAQRMIEDNLKLVDAVCEILDARIPYSSRNPDIDRLAGDKPRLVILNRCDLADPDVTARWKKYFQERGLAILETDARSGRGVAGFVPAVRTLLSEKLREYEVSMANTTQEQYVRNKVEIARTVEEIAERISYARSNGL